MKSKDGEEPMAMAIDDEKQNATPTLTSSSSPKPEDEREDWSADAREMNEERESSSSSTAMANSNSNNQAPEVQEPKKATKPSPSRKKATQQRRYPPTADSVYPYQPSYPPGRSYPPPPPPYGYPSGGIHDYRGPPPHPHHYHPHHLPPPHHPHQYNPYGPPPPGRHQSYHHPHHPYATSAPYPMMYHSGPPPPPPPPPHHGSSSSSTSAAIHPYPPPNGPMPPGIAASDSGSVASSSKTTATNKKYNNNKSASRKKRTIDGIAQETKDLTSAFTFRRTNSNTSNSSVTTLGNNTSNDNNTHQSDESTQPTAKLPPTMLSTSPSSHHHNHHNRGSASHNIFDEHHNDHHPQHNILRGGGGDGARHHRRTFSGASTASTLSVGGFSLGSYEGARIKANDSMIADETPLTKSSPKRRKGSDLSSTPLMMIDTDSGRPPSWSSRHHRSILSQNSFQSLGDVATDSSVRFEQLTMDDNHDRKASSSKQHDSMAASSSGNLFLTLSTSPINAAAADVEATPISKNTRKSLMVATGSVTKVEVKGRGISSRKLGQRKSEGVSPIKIDVSADTPSPPISKAPSTERETITEEHMLNRHLRGQSFTPLPHLSITGGAESVGTSPTNTAFSVIAPQLSWSITGDTPSLGDLADWEEDRQQAQKLESKRPSSTTSQSSAGTRGTNMVISPHSFTMWREEHESTSGRSTTGNATTGGGGSSSNHLHQHKGDGSSSNRGDVVVGGGESSVRFLRLSPNSDIAGDEALSGTTTPLPVFFDHPSAEERDENMRRHQLSPSAKSSSLNHGNARHHHHHHQQSQHQQQLQSHHHHLHHHQQHNQHQQQQQHHNAMSQQHPGDHDHSMAGHWGHKGGNNNNKGPWQHMDPNNHGPPMIGSLPPTPVYAAMEFHDEFIRSPHHSGERRDGPPDFFPSNAYAHAAHNDRIRNLRGRLPPGSHLPPMPLHIPQQVTSHPLTSPMGLGPPTPHGKPMWSPHGMPPPMGSPHHMSPMDMSQSKRKCVPLKPPIPSKFQGDMEKLKSAQVPEFTGLVNFPAHMSQKQSVNLPDGMRCCVMCGQACPCSTGNKSKKSSSSVKSSDSSLAPRNSNGQDAMLGCNDGKNSPYAIIPTQNKGLCTLCDVNVWIVVTTGLEIKWCKGCKNFRPWASFGDKGLATKCLRCRERQREKYALQKEEKEKSRMVTKSLKPKML